MTFLPIVERELRVASRRHSTFWIRLVTALGAIGIGLFLYFVDARASRQSVAKGIFVGLGVLAMLYCLVSGRQSTADCLSEEKREGTLGLLFLTDLKGYDVVLGKLVATSLNGFYGLLAIVPVLAIPLLLGGVSNAEFWRVVLVLVNTFLLSLALGIFASVLSHDARQAMGLNLLLLLALTGIPPACAAVIAYLSPAHPFCRELLLSCPPYALYLSFDLSYKSNADVFWLSAAVVHSLTWLLVGVSSWILPRSWQDQKSGAAGPGWRELGREKWRRLVYGNPRQRKALRTRLLELNPFCWLASRSRFKPVAVWGFLGFVTCWWLFMRFSVQINSVEETLSLTTALMLNSVLKLWIAIEAGQRLAEEQKMGTLELLLATPLDENQILRGQLLALKRQFLKPLALVLGVEVLFVLVVPRFSFPQDSSQIWLGLAGILMLLFDLLTLTWVAFLSALTARNPNHASVSTISRVLILPWILFGGLAAIANLITAGGKPLGWMFFLNLWFWLGLGVDLAVGLPAWRQARTKFRQLALRRLSVSRST